MEQHQARGGRAARGGQNLGRTPSRRRSAHAHGLGDGPGFALAEAPAGHGLDTLRAQLAAIYGGQAWLEVQPESIGTRVAMRLLAWSAEGRLR